MVVARREREAALRRHEIERRLEPGDAAPGRRDADRAARVAAERELDLPGGDRSRRAAARAAGEPSRRARVRHRAEVRVLRADPVGELVQVRLPGDGVPGGLEPQYRLGALRGHVLGEDRRAVRRDEPRRVEQVLDRDRNALARLVGPGEPDPVAHID